MFEPPSNLPVEPGTPTNGPAPEPPLDMNTPARPSSSLPKPPATPEGSAPTPPTETMRRGLVMPKKEEPEDIFGDLDKGEQESGEHAMEGHMAPRGTGRWMRIALIVVGTIAGLAVLALVGYVFYDRFIAAQPGEPLPLQDQTSIPPSPSPTPAVTEQPPVVPTPEPTPQDEFPPTVEPTPAPADIPAPTPVQTPGLDADGDGLTDAQEASFGTNSAIADTDGDGLRDGEEVGPYSTNPLVTDTDGDGLSDGDEVRVWNTSPTVPDTDGDGYTDGMEVQNGFNPNGPGRLPEAQ